MSEEIVFLIDKDPDSHWLVASWEDPVGGGITTQGRDLAELQVNLREAVACHFGAGRTPASFRLHFEDDPVVMAG